MNAEGLGRLAELAERHGRMVFATAYRILGCPEDAEDVLQEVFLKLLARNGHLQSGTVLDWGAYLRVMASRCAVDVLRRRPKWQADDNDVLEDIPAPADQNPRRSAIQHQKAHLLREALAMLPERDARIFALRYFEELSYEDIARQTGEDASAVGVILHRARKRLQAILEPLLARDGQRVETPEKSILKTKGE